jgi:hypothetical protein
VDFHSELLLPELAELEQQLNAALGQAAFADLTERGAGMSLDSIASLFVTSG